VCASGQQLIQPFLFEDDLADTEVRPALPEVVGENGFVLDQLTLDEMGADVYVGENGFF